MIRGISLITVLALSLQHALYPGNMTDAHDRTVTEIIMERVNQNGVLERKPKLRSRLNTHLIYKK